MLGIAAAAGLVLGGVGAEELSIEVDLVWVVVSLEHDAACYVFGCAAVSGTGNAQGTYAVSGTGAATGCEPEFYDPILYFHEPCFAASGAGDATGAWAVTATGDAEGRHSFCATVGPPTQLVITGACLTQVAVSGTGRARACGGGEEVHCGIAVSGTGPAEAWIGVSGANDCGGTRCFDGQAVGPAEADTLAVSVLGPSSSKLLAVSVLGDSSSESAAVSVLGEASGPSSVSALGLSQQVASCNCVAVAVGEDASAEVLAVSAFGDASGLAALSGTGGSQGTAAASATGPAEGIVATSALGPATGRQLAASLGGPAATSGPCSDACVALSGTGPAHACSAPPFVLEHHVVGCTAVSVAGPSSSCESCSGTAVSVLGPASGGIAASGAGDADAGMENAILYSVGDAG
ncbi:MAG TPA: hypothetical protein VGR28_06740, partial [Candidatus Thermoplasmatota archaeon]|nr:hypothetical protein [Candidatus Thermoplasmatota archaeon]